jgi:hypothetical protein
MTPYRNNGATPGWEELTAYVDGELDAAARTEVEAWLADHPEASAEVEAQRHLRCVCQAAGPSDPGEAAWAAALTGIEAALTGARAAKAPGQLSGSVRKSRQTWSLFTLRLASTAAAVFLLVALDRAPHEPSFPSPEPFPVASPDDVDIISVHGSDAGMLVVGDPPLGEPLALLAAGDVHVERVQPDEDGMMPQVLFEAANPAAPMIVAPLGAER